jgi:hypothetical protein
VLSGSDVLAIGATVLCVLYFVASHL